MANPPAAAAAASSQAPAQAGESSFRDIWNGFEAVHDHLQIGCRDLELFAKQLKERGKCEADYAKDLAKITHENKKSELQISETTLSKCHLDTRKCWQDMAAHHATLGTSLHNLTDKINQTRKEVNDTSHELEKQYSQNQRKLKQLTEKHDKAQKKYGSAVEYGDQRQTKRDQARIDAAGGDENAKKKVDSFQQKADKAVADAQKAKDEYRASVTELTAHQAYNDEFISSALFGMQQLEKKRLDVMKSVMEDVSKIHWSYIANVEKSLAIVQTTVGLLHPETDIKKYADDHKPKTDKPKHVEFIEVKTTYQAREPPAPVAKPQPKAKAAPKAAPKAPPAAPVPAAAAVELCKALYDLQPEHDTELGFKEDEIITILSHEGADWFFGRNQAGQEGMFPSNYVELL